MCPVGRAAHRPDYMEREGWDHSETGKEPGCLGSHHTARSDDVPAFPHKPRLGLWLSPTLSELRGCNAPHTAHGCGYQSEGNTRSVDNGCSRAFCSQGRRVPENG